MGVTGMAVTDKISVSLIIRVVLNKSSKKLHLSFDHSAFLKMLHIRKRLVFRANSCFIYYTQ